MTGTTELVVAGRRLRMTNLDKVLYPVAGFTKAAVIDYCLRIAPALVPHLKGRQITFHRFPEGVRGLAFFEKNCPAHRPPWVRTTPAWSEHRQRTTCYCLIGDLPSLIWAANLAALELHPSLSLAEHQEQPTAVAFDLDPGAPADLLACARVALALRSLLVEMKLEAFPKTSGAKGLQVYVPLNTKATYGRTKTFALAVAQLLERQLPDLVLSNMKKSLRSGKILVDWSQNDVHKTTICVYSLRAQERPTVSTPVSWDELEKALRVGRSDGLRFEAADVLKRVERLGDLFAPVLTLKQTLPALH